MHNYSVKELEKIIEDRKKEEEEKTEKKKTKFSKKIVVSIILLNIIFTAVVFYSFLKVGNEPMTLIGAWFAFTTVELWSLSKIKRDEIKEDCENENRLEG
ncbi:MAG TPA: hypothetical protein VFC60_03910 [Tissierellaceae bacterium]|nr:hypothetical protein [Tissierellaceae bacterium]